MILLCSTLLQDKHKNKNFPNTHEDISYNTDYPWIKKLNS